MGRNRRGGRDVHGVVLLDKPRGLGSNQVLQIVKRLFRARKAGHTGSLDRLASGLLPICAGEATKLSGFLLNADKRYRAGIRLGVRTATGDAEGEVVDTRPVPRLCDEAVEAALERFRGPIEQIPPMHSALKHHGQRLYKLAHQGITVEREPRRIVIHRLVCRHWDQDRLDLDVDCSKGTYIRTLSEDIGEALGTTAHVDELRRVGSGPFGEDEMVSLEALQAAEQSGSLDRYLTPIGSGALRLARRFALPRYRLVSAQGPAREGAPRTDGGAGFGCVPRTSGSWASERCSTTDASLPAA